MQNPEPFPAAENGTTPAPPAGFQPLDCDPFMAPLGPFYMRAYGDGLMEIGVYADNRHGNKFGGVHGGMLAALVDFALGMNILADIRAQARPAHLATVSLNVDYVSGAQTGEWLLVTPTIDKREGRLRFCSCVVTAGNGRIVLRATAIMSATPMKALA